MGGLRWCWDKLPFGVIFKVAFDFIKFLQLIDNDVILGVGSPHEVPRLVHDVAC